VTSQPEPGAGEARSAVPFLRPLRDIAAYVLVAVPAVLLLVAVIRLIPSGVGETFSTRTQDSFSGFVNVPTIFFPLGAVLLTLLVQPQHPRARLIVLAAAAEYAVGALFGVLFGVLVGLVQIAGFSVRTAFEELLVRLAWLALFAVAAFAVCQIWRNLFVTPKPKPQPGVYGQPQYGVPGTYPGQPGYGQPGQQWGQPSPGQPTPGQPGWAQPGHPTPGQPAHPAPSQPAYGQPPTPAGWGQSAPPSWGQPPPSGQPAATQPLSGQPAATQPPSGQPAATQPLSGQPASAPPGPFAPAPGHPQPPAFGSAQPGPDGSAQPPYAAFSEPTQAVPRPQPQDDDRTRVVGDDRPGFGPAEEDPSRR
jgi:hypothetical protein